MKFHICNTILFLLLGIGLCALGGFESKNCGTIILVLFGWIFTTLIEVFDHKNYKK